MYMNGISAFNEGFIYPHTYSSNYEDLSYSNNTYIKPSLENWYTTNIVNAGLDDYVAGKKNPKLIKQLDERLEEARSILEDREKLFKLKEEELRNSKEWIDIIYTYYFLEKLSIRKIEKKIPFSSTEIFRKIKIIRKNINLEQKGTKIGLQ